MGELLDETARELARYRAAAEKLARYYETEELAARHSGAYDAAVDYQQFAAWAREGSGQLATTYGSPAKILLCRVSNVLVGISGDALGCPDVMNMLTVEVAGRSPAGLIIFDLLDATTAWQDSGFALAAAERWLAALARYREAGGR